MVTRNARIADFTIDQNPALGRSVELLCEDHVGTYVLPFPCRFEEGAWLNAETEEPLGIAVLGWRYL
jgi:hypothetical protein